MSTIGTGETVDWMGAVVEMIRRLDRVADELQHIALRLDDIVDAVRARRL